MARCILPDFVSIPLTVIATMFSSRRSPRSSRLAAAFAAGCFSPRCLLGALGGHLFAAGFDRIWPGLSLIRRLRDHRHERAIGLGDGGPLTMSLIALNPLAPPADTPCWSRRHLDPYHPRTVRLFVRDLAISPARRNHRSAADVGWIRDLTVLQPDAAGRDQGASPIWQSESSATSSARFQDPGDRG